MNIVTEKKEKGRIQDGIETILNLDKTDFENFLKSLSIEQIDIYDDKVNFYYSTDKCKKAEEPIKLGFNERNDRLYFARGSMLSVKELVSEIREKAEELKKEPKKYARCRQIENQRNLDAVKEYLSKGDSKKRERYDKIFDNLLNSKNLDNITDEKDLRAFGEIFNYRQKEVDGNYIQGIEFLKNLNIPKEQIETLEKNANYIYDKYTEKYARYIDKRYEFRTNYGYGELDPIRKNDEPKWEVSKELKDAVFADMPQDLPPEGKATYIYTKLCELLDYDEEYLFRKKGISTEFNSDFSKEKLENVKPNSKITCFEFTRIFSKLTNELDGDIEAVVIPQGTNRGHFLSGFYTDNVSVRLEAVNASGDRKKRSNDLMKAKNKVALEGICPIYDNKKIMPKAKKRAYQLIYKREPLTIEECIQEIGNEELETRKTEKNEGNKTNGNEEKMQEPQNFEEKIQAFIQVMGNRGIVGNEFTQTFNAVANSGFFGDGEKHIYLGRRSRENGEDHIQRILLVRNKETNLYKNQHHTLKESQTQNQIPNSNQNHGQIRGIRQRQNYNQAQSQYQNRKNKREEFYLIDTSSLDMIKATEQEIVSEINRGDMVYEAEKHTLSKFIDIE